VTAYAGIDDLVALFETAPKVGRHPRLESLLETAATELNGELGGFDYFRHPTAGTRTWLANGNGEPVLHLHRGIVELELVEISLDRGYTFVALEPTDWALAWDADSLDDPPAGEPWFHLRILPTSLAYRTFPRGVATVRFTGASGWPAIPYPLVEGNAERARQLWAAGAMYEGSVASDDGYGQPTVSMRLPDVTWKFIQREKQRFMTCSL
jgi:hypothetical protein